MSVRCASDAAAGPAPTGRQTGVVKRVLLYSDSGDQAVVPQMVYAFLHSPLLLGDVELRAELRPSPRGDGVARLPDLSAGTLAGCDLVIVPQGELQYLDKDGVQALCAYLDRGGAALLVQPQTAAGELPAALAARLGAEFLGWVQDTPGYSYLADHPAARVLGLRPGDTVYPHRRYWPHMCFAARPSEADVLTELAPGLPDLFLSRHVRAAVFATDAFHDLSRLRVNPEQPECEERLALLFANAVRPLLGLPFLDQPVPRDQRLWRELLQAYASTKLFMLATRDALPEQPAADSFDVVLDEADAAATEAARAAVAGQRDPARQAYRRAIELLARAMAAITTTERYLHRGWHGGLVFPDYRRAGLVGCAEGGWPDWLVAWMRRQLDWATLARRALGDDIAPVGQINDISPQTWEVLAEYYPEDVAAIRLAVREGWLETIGPLYAQAYLEICGPEANIRHFEEGRQVIKEVLGEDVTVYLSALDHYDFHPQLPQILNSFGYRYAVLRCGGPGLIRGVDAEKLWWQGLDGSRIEALPTYAGIEMQRMPLWTPAQVVSAERSGLKRIVLGRAVDATRNSPWEKEDMIVNAVAPVLGRMTTATGFMQAIPTPSAKTTFYFDADDLNGRPQWWAGYSSVNFFYGWQRRIERALVAAEAFGAVASLLVPDAADERMTARIKRAWRDLLTTHDHFTSGCGDAGNPEGFHSGSLHQPSILDYPGPAIKPGTWEKTLELLEGSERVAQEALAAALRNLAAQVDTRAAAADHNAAVVVFNPLVHPREEVVSVALPAARNGTEGLRAVDLASGGAAPAQVVRGPDGDTQALLTVRVPSLGYATYTLAAPGAEEDASELVVSPTVLENRFYRLELHPRHGGVVRLWDKELGRDWLRAADHVGNELACDSEPQVSSRHGRAVVAIEEAGPVRAALRIDGQVASPDGGGPAYPYTCVIRLTAGSRRIDFDLDIDFGAGAIFGRKMEELGALRARFPFGLDPERSVFSIHQPFGIYPTRKELQVSLDFGDLSDVASGDGVALFHQDTPCYGREGDTLSLVLADAFPPIRGRHRFRYALYPHRGNVHSGRVHAAAQAYCEALLAVPVAPAPPGTPGGERLPARAAFFSVEEDRNAAGGALAVSCLRRQGEHLVARLYECGGGARRAQVGFFRGLSGLEEVALDGPPQRALPAEGDRAAVALRPWQILTLRWAANGSAEPVDGRPERSGRA